MAIANLSKHNRNVFDGLWYGSLQFHIGGRVVRCSLKPSAFGDHHLANVARDTPRSYEAYPVNTSVAFGLSKDQASPSCSPRMPTLYDALHATHRSVRLVGHRRYRPATAPVRSSGCSPGHPGYPLAVR